VVVDEEECMLHAKPWNSFHPVINVPQAVVYPLYVRLSTALPRKLTH